MQPIGALYIHVPFCVARCAYCDFVSMVARRDSPCMDQFIQERLEELQALKRAGMLREVRTSYIGGGTPTHLGAGRLRTLVEAVRSCCPHLFELSVEANPESLGNDVIETLVASGATRLSIGVQSLNDAELVALGRIHSAEHACDRVRAAVASGLAVSLDLMCAVPQQTSKTWADTLAGVVDLGVGHVSVYPLSLEEGTPLGERYAEADPGWNSEDVQAERMEQAAHVLGKAGYARYEVASYAKPGAECLHNEAYWTGVPYLGLGPGAASMLNLDDGYRLRFVEPDLTSELLSREEALAEDLMLGMRMTRGISAGLIAAAKEVFGSRAATTFDDAVSNGLAQWTEGRLVPTHRGWLLGNELYGELWGLADQT